MYFAPVFLLLCITSASGMKVSVEGSVNLGKDVLETIAEYLGYTFRGSRRSLLPSEEDPISTLIRSSFAEMEMCETESCGKLKKYIEEYTIILAKTVNNVLEKAFSSDFNQSDFENQLENYTNTIKEILNDNSVDTENDTYFWLVMLKKINSKFQELSLTFISHLNLDSIASVDKNYIRQKMILATVVIEMNYANTLCGEYNVCMKTYQVTDILLDTLEALANVPEEKINSFIRALYSASYATSFYEHINEETAHQLQVFIYDIIESKDGKATNLLENIRGILNEHLNVMKSTTSENLSSDRRLVHVILSDLDLIYVIQSSKSFADFIQHFYDFIKLDKKIDGDIQHFFVTIENVVSTLSSDYFNKLVNEVQVLLDILLYGK